MAFGAESDLASPVRPEVHHAATRYACSSLMTFTSPWEKLVRFVCAQTDGATWLTCGLRCVDAASRPLLLSSQALVPAQSFRSARAASVPAPLPFQVGFPCDRGHPRSD